MSVTAGVPRPDPGAIQRFAFVDLIKGVAIVAMVIYHTGFDLSLQRLFGVDIIADPAWTAFARLIAGTFLGLVGFNLALAHARGFRPRRFLVRLAVIAGLAAVVTAVTYGFDRTTFVYFGILHQIALSSLVGAAFLRVPLPVLLGCSAVAFALPAFATSPVFDAPWFWWLGLSAKLPASIDYVPFLPWFGVTLLGMAAGRLFLARGTGTAVARWQPRGRLADGLILAGRWTLPIYMIHQPILFGLIFLVAQVVPPDIDSARAAYVQQCRQSVCDGGSACTGFCTCVFEGIWDTDLYAMRTLEEMSPDQRTRWDDTLSACALPPAPTL